MVVHAIAKLGSMVHAYRNVYRNVYRHVCRHVCWHVCWHICRHVYRHVYRHVFCHVFRHVYRHMYFDMLIDISIETFCQHVINRCHKFGTSGETDIHQTKKLVKSETGCAVFGAYFLVTPGPTITGNVQYMGVCWCLYNVCEHILRSDR